MRILINGAETAIGGAVADKAVLLAQEAGTKARIALVSRSEVNKGVINRLQSAGADVLTLKGDGDTATPARVTAEAISFCGGLDLLTSTSLFVSTGGPLDLAVEDWDFSINRNIRENLLYAQAAREALAQSQGSIIFLCATAATNPVLGLGSITPAMAGLHMFTRHLGDEWSKERIRVNAVSIGIKPGPLQHQATAADVAAMFSFLAREGSYMTGQIVAVDGGAAQFAEPVSGQLGLVEIARCA